MSCYALHLAIILINNALIGLKKMTIIKKIVIN